MSIQPSTDGAVRAGHRGPSVSVVLPCLNEERNLPHVLEQMPRDIELILVDGGSVDNTVQRARELWPTVTVVHQTRKGKGNALACGFAACTNDIVVMLDGDGSTDPGEIPAFVEALTSGAEFAKGSRFAQGGTSHDITRMRSFGNYGLSWLANRLFHTRYSDLCYGYNAFWRWILPHLDLPDIDAPAPADGRMLWGDGFEIETLINVRVAALGLKVAEVGSVESERLHGVSNLNAFRDGKRVLRTIMNEYRQRERHHLVRQPAVPVEAVPVEAVLVEAAAVQAVVPKPRVPARESLSTTLEFPKIQVNHVPAAVPTGQP